MYISASTEPFSEEMEIDESKMVHWLDFFGITYEYEKKGKKKKFVRRHVSGHASKSELFELIEKIAPLKIIPIHTIKPNLFEAKFKQRVILPSNSQPIHL
jgi:mRNA degradation ribonuclease J1/J2